ncbi:X2-like carbohydrate binding domain-containing protein [Streptomyces paradoxus]|uniref:X2-like carbohydrate binding domain-containing protein n=1 Tax=Streptomyces paradoxus TaxID=66375 RepID=UPI003629F225
MLWDAGQFLNRNTLQWRDPELFAQIKSSWTTRSGTASSDLVFLPKSDAVTSRTFSLSLNGTDFQGRRHGSRNLLKGRDYTVSGNQLTLTATALTELAGDRAYGVNATLEASFSRGVPWRIDVITYDTPVLSNASGDTGGLTIPTRFRGDMLATMEAKYDDGTNAGPANWTSYQQWDAAFTAYTGDSVKLTRDFVSSLKDNARVTLTFHFWSGAKVTYQVTKAGSTVTGTTA